MKKLEFSTEINAPAEKVWDVLWNEKTYSDWTSTFNPSGASYMKADWKQGGRTLFTDGSGDGMLAEIATLETNKKVHFKHIGQIVDGVEDTTSDDVKAFAGAMETYHLEEKNGKTKLSMSVDTHEKWEDMMTNGFTKGIARVKELSEQ